MIIEVDGDKFYYEKLSNRGCSANRKVMMVLVVVISLCVLLLLALFYVVLSRTWSTRTRTSSFKKAEIQVISGPMPLSVHPYSRKYSYQKCNNGV